MFVTNVGVLGHDELADAVAAAGFNVVRDLTQADLVLVGDADVERVVDTAPGHAIIAPTGTASITELADFFRRPEQVVGFHPVGPRLVEIVEGLATAPEVAQQAANFAQAIRRTPIRCADSPGFVVERIQAADDPVAEARAVLEEDVAAMRDIDTAMQLGAGMTPGPFADAYASPPPGAEGLVGVETREDIAILWLSNPPANSLGPAMVSALEAAWQSVEPRVRAVMICSANPALWCAGADIKAFAQMDTVRCKALLDQMHGLLRAMEDSRVATIAAVNGLALGGGCELAMACDVRLAGYSATFGQPEINLGIIPGFGGTQRLPRLVGAAKALEMNLTGDAISADDPFLHGLVNRVVPDQDLFAVALQWARKLASKSPVAVQTIKQVSQHGTLEEGLAAEKQGFAAAFGSEDGKEGVMAFIEKRRPVWQGR